MATRTDFTEAEWVALEKGVTGSGMLVSLSDRDLSDTFGEIGAMSKYLAGQRVAASSGLVRELANVHGTGFGVTASPDRVRAETMDALRTSIATLTLKAPDEVDAYRALVLGVAQVVAEAKSGAAPAETAMIAAIREALAAG